MVAHCPICASTDWQMLGRDGTTYVLLAVHEVGGHRHGVTVDDGLFVEPHVCENCGYVRLQSRDHTWARAQH